LDSKQDSGLHLGPVCLVVRDINVMLDFYVKDLGLKMTERDNQTVELRPSEHVSEPLLILWHDMRTEIPPRDAAGLYHYALLVPDRTMLGSTYLAIGKAGVIFDGHADHQVSEALYLTDPEGNGIEIYADRPREQWKFDEDGKVQMGTLPLDVDSLLRDASETPDDSLIAIPEGTKVGHMHLKVTDLGRSIAFYEQLIGLDLMSYWGSAAFLSVGGYHHHIGINTWQSLGGPSRQRQWSGLDFFTMRITEEQVSELYSRLIDGRFVYSEHSGGLIVPDPDGIELLIKPL
jgi:catechol 2,3-dioxygenase